MNFWNFAVLAGGLVLFLYGMCLLEEGFSGVVGKRMRYWLEKMTDTPAKGILAGAGVTALLQSSSVTTVTVVGLVDSGVLDLQQATLVIMGANIGTTVTAWIMGILGTDGSYAIFHIVQWKGVFLLWVLAGLILRWTGKRRKTAEWISVPIGFSLLLLGMHTMGRAVGFFVDVPEFADFLVYMESPFRGMLAGMLLTAVIQSSSASLGILQAMCSTEAVSCRMAVPFIMGQNVGTCVTALLACAGSGRNAKSAAVIHLCFNVVSAGVFLPLFCMAGIVLPDSIFNQPMNCIDIALVHSLFNIGGTALLLPKRRELMQLVCFYDSYSPDVVPPDS